MTFRRIALALAAPVLSVAFVGCQPPIEEKKEGGAMSGPGAPAVTDPTPAPTPNPAPATTEMKPEMPAPAPATPETKPETPAEKPAETKPDMPAEPKPQP